MAYFEFEVFDVLCGDNGIRSTSAVYIASVWQLYLGANCTFPEKKKTNRLF